MTNRDTRLMQHPEQIRFMYCKLYALVYWQNKLGAVSIPYRLTSSKIYVNFVVGRPAGQIMGGAYIAFYMTAKNYNRIYDLIRRAEMLSLYWSQ
jgi:intergrase/recombinase